MQVAGTASCSAGFGEFTMSFREVTTCDVVSVQPRCPTSRLPLDRTFPAAGARRLADLARTPACAGAAPHSRFHLAGFVETALTGQGGLGLLVGGLPHHSEATQRDPAFVAAVRRASAGGTAPTGLSSRRRRPMPRRGRVGPGKPGP